MSSTQQNKPSSTNTGKQVRPITDYISTVTSKMSKVASSTPSEISSIKSSISKNFKKVDPKTEIRPSVTSTEEIKPKPKKPKNSTSDYITIVAKDLRNLLNFPKFERKDIYNSFIDLKLSTSETLKKSVSLDSPSISAEEFENFGTKDLIKLVTLYDFYYKIEKEIFCRKEICSFEEIFSVLSSEKEELTDLTKEKDSLNSNVLKTPRVDSFFAVLTFFSLEDFSLRKLESCHKSFVSVFKEEIKNLSALSSEVLSMKNSNSYSSSSLKGFLKILLALMSKKKSFLYANFILQKVDSSNYLSKLRVYLKNFKEMNLILNQAEDEHSNFKKILHLPTRNIGYLPILRSLYILFLNSKPLKTLTENIRSKNLFFNLNSFSFITSIYNKINNKLKKSSDYKISSLEEFRIRRCVENLENLHNTPSSNSEVRLLKTRNLSAPTKLKEAIEEYFFRLLEERENNQNLGSILNNKGKKLIHYEILDFVSSTNYLETSSLSYRMEKILSLNTISSKNPKYNSEQLRDFSGENISLLKSSSGRSFFLSFKEVSIEMRELNRENTESYFTQVEKYSACFRMKLFCSLYSSISELNKRDSEETEEVNFGGFSDNLRREGEYIDGLTSSLILLQSDISNSIKSLLVQTSPFASSTISTTPSSSNNTNTNNNTNNDSNDVVKKIEEEAIEGVGVCEDCFDSFEFVNNLHCPISHQSIKVDPLSEISAVKTFSSLSDLKIFIEDKVRLSKLNLFLVSKYPEELTEHLKNLKLDEEVLSVMFRKFNKKYYYSEAFLAHTLSWYLLKLRLEEIMKLETVSAAKSLKYFSLSDLSLYFNSLSLKIKKEENKESREDRELKIAKLALFDIYNAFDSSFFTYNSFLNSESKRKKFLTRLSFATTRRKILMAAKEFAFSVSGTFFKKEFSINNFRTSIKASLLTGLEYLDKNLIYDLVHYKTICGKELSNSTPLKAELGRESWITENDFCEVCRGREGGNRMLLCDFCEMNWHFHCLDVKLNGMPHGNWFCPDCLPPFGSHFLSSSYYNSFLFRQREESKRIKRSVEKSEEEVGEVQSEEREDLGVRRSKFKAFSLEQSEEERVVKKKVVKKKVIEIKKKKSKKKMDLEESTDDEFYSGSESSGREDEVGDEESDDMTQ